MAWGRITQSMVSRNVLADLNRSSQRLTNTQAKLSSGKEITRPSDDPFGTAKALGLRESLAAARQHQRTVNDSMGWQESSELALGNITDATHRVRELLLQGASDTSTPESREALASEIDQLVAAIKQHANASYRGSYVFAGTETGTPPYADGADDSYHGNATLIAREIGPGVSLHINLPGEDILGNGQAAGDDKLLDVLRDISDDLRAGDSSALRTSDLPRLDTNLDSLLALRAANGARSNRLEAVLGRLQQIEEITTGALSETEDADFAKTMVDFSTQQAAYQSALKSAANIVQPSLMDFLR